MADDSDTNMKKGVWATLGVVILAVLARLVGLLPFGRTAAQLLITVPAVVGDCCMLMMHDGPVYIHEFILEPRNFMHGLTFYIVMAILLANGGTILHWTIQIIRWFFRRRPGTRKVLLWIFFFAFLFAAGTACYYERDLLIQRLATLD